MLPVMRLVVVVVVGGGESLDGDGMRRGWGCCRVAELVWGRAERERSLLDLVEAEPQR